MCLLSPCQVTSRSNASDSHVKTQSIQLRQRREVSDRFPMYFFRGNRAQWKDSVGHFAHIPFSQLGTMRGQQFQFRLFPGHDDADPWRSRESVGWI